MNLNIFIPEVSDRSAVNDYILPLIREAIEEGAFHYPYYIEKNQTDKAGIVYTYLFSTCVAQKTFAVALDSTTSAPVGFESYLKSPFCDFFKTSPIYDGVLTFVSKSYRNQKVASRLRRFLLEQGNFHSGDKFRFSVEKNNTAGYLSVDKLAKELNISMVETGITYEGQLTHQLDI
jgi:biotin operon repressor